MVICIYKMAVLRLGNIVILKTQYVGAEGACYAILMKSS
jgi:hypothetical protein